MGDWFERRIVRIIGTGFLIALVIFGVRVEQLHNDLDAAVDTGERIERLVIESSETQELLRCAFGLLLLSLDDRPDALQSLPENVCGLTPEQIDDLIALVGVDTG